MKKHLLVGVLSALMVFVACSSKQIMKDCKALGDGFYRCEKP
jgi:major membrane immunogen (membrane-anchored lipoprotein)